MATSAYMTGRKKYNRPQAILWSDNPGTKDGNAYYPTGTEPDDFIILSDHNRSEISMTKQRIETRQRMINGIMRSYHVDDKINISLSWNNLPSRSFSRKIPFGLPGNTLSSRAYFLDIDGTKATLHLEPDHLFSIGDEVVVTNILPLTEPDPSLIWPSNLSGIKVITEKTSDTISFTFSPKDLPPLNERNPREEYDVVASLIALIPSALVKLSPTEEYIVDTSAGGTDLLNWYETHSGPFWVYLSYDTHATYDNNRPLTNYNEVRHMYFSSFDYVVAKRSANFDFWNVSVALEEV
jgi:hypothetical protein